MNVLVFDASLWYKTGDVGDNSMFWKPAKILAFEDRYGERTCIVQFDDGRISNGHFYSALRPML